MIPLAKPDITPEDRLRLNQVLDSGKLADGDAVREFETKFAAYCGCSAGIAAANGTVSLQAM